MRTMDYGQSKKAQRRSFVERHKKQILLGIIVILCVGFALFYTKHSEAPSDKAVMGSRPPAEAPKKGVLKIYTPQQFRDLYNNFAYPNTEKISDKTPITGNELLDERIRTIAVQRGYSLRSAPVTNAFQQVAPGMLLQERAAKPWLDMQAAAKKDNITLGLGAAYRSAGEQLSIFLSRFAPRSASASRIAAGAYDKQIINTLTKTAPPGYSRHHSGYTIDIVCDNNINQVFDHTACFRWLSADNYKNAKTFGWIPSYPEGTDAQGPEPETWEYVWVGIDTLTE